LSDQHDAGAVAVLRSAGLFRDIPEAALLALARSSSLVEAQAGSVIVREGDVGAALFLVAEGRLSVLVGNEKVSELAPGELFGELQAIAGGTRSATVQALTPCRLLEIARAGFDEAALLSPALRLELAALMRNRLERNLLAAALLRVLGPLQASALAELQASAALIPLRAGEVLFRQGDAGDAWYVVMSGRLRVLKNERVLRELGRGESIGEAALLLGQPRTATIDAARDSALARFPAAVFEQVMKQNPGSALSIARTVVGRMATLPITSCVNIVLVPAAGSSGLLELARSLTLALSSLGRALLVSEDLDLARLPEGHPAWLRFSAWLDERADDHQFLVFACDDPRAPWARRAMREADELFLVAGASHQVVLPEGLPERARRTLLLLHPEDAAMPSGTAAKLSTLKASRVLHLRRAADLARVARIVAGRAVCVVLGAGGVRASAHIGVLRAIVEAGIEIDCLGGTSAGAMAATTYASGHTPAEMSVLNGRFLKRKPFGDYVLPISALLRGRRIERAVRDEFGERCFEDLWLPCFSTACDTSVFREVVHDRGPVVPALLASAAIPGVLPPHLIDGHMYVDGGVSCALPGKAMRQRFSGTLIAVDISTERDYFVPEEHYPSSWAAFLRRLRPSAARPSRLSLPELVLRAISLGTAGATAEVARDADLFLRPPVERYGTMDLRAASEIERIGYEYTREQLVTWALRKKSS
jgi:NTE family protein